MKKRYNFLRQNRERAIRIPIEESIPNDSYNSNYICSMEQARLKIKEATESKNIRYDNLKNHIDFRNELIRQIRRNSSLTLKQIGELFGGISESRVSRILAKCQ